MEGDARAITLAGAIYRASHRRRRRSYYRFLWSMITPLRVVLPEFPLLAVLLAAIVITVVHELIHAVVHPRAGGRPIRSSGCGIKDALLRALRW